MYMENCIEICANKNKKGKFILKFQLLRFWNFLCFAEYSENFNFQLSTDDKILALHSKQKDYGVIMIHMMVCFYWRIR
jgi:hypothetical protein